ncbi:TonB-dependent receptor [Frateuria defendens]|uniref:TonB-dependent receptor n=1 Tax=Frateuria defendens TaxID=2219559 RepID=UPI0009E659AD|nr:TonB-dependent receptor [Frateuria defendens]
MPAGGRFRHARIQPGRNRRTWLGLCLLALCLGARAATPAGERPYHIAAGSLDEALRAFARQSGVQLLYAPALTAARRTAGLDGRFDAPHALARLLRDSGLRAEAVDGGTFVLEHAPAPAPAGATPLPAIPAPTAPTELGPVEVTGTHLRRTRLEAAGQLSVIDRGQIERSGYQTLYDLLRTQPGIRVSNAPVAISDGPLYLRNGLSGATGAAAVDLRGLGSSATLFLVDGQRLVSYGMAQGEFGVVPDLNSIPLALIERIEILRDGASAVYGSDAMAGVVNIILRKRFDGVEVSGNSGISERGDAAQRRASATFGGALGRGHALLSVDYFQRDPLLGRQRGWATSGYDQGNGIYYLNEGQIKYASGVGCRHFRQDDACDTNPYTWSSLQTGLLSRSLLGHLDQPLGNTVQFDLDLRWTGLRQRQQAAPPAEQLLVTTPGGVRPLLYSFDDIGPVQDRIASRTGQLTLGLRNTAGDWHWQVRLDGQRNRSDEYLRGPLRNDVMNAALRSGAYQLGVDDNPPALLAALAPPLRRHGDAGQTGFNAHLDGPLATWPAGDVLLAAGVESYREWISDHPDPLLVGNQVFQFQPPYTRRGSRRISAAYGELELPLANRLSANLAARVDHSSGYGSAVSPRLGLKWDLADSFSLRGTWTRGYRAPTLPELSRPLAPSANNFLLVTPTALLPCHVGIPNGYGSVLCLLRLDSSGNPSLRPETSHSFTVGAVWAPLPSLGITLDLYQVRRSNEITQLPLSYALTHPQAFPQLFVRDANGVLVALRQQPVNLGHTVLRTIDFDLRYRLGTARYGSYTFNLGFDWLAALRQRIVPGEPESSYAGYADQPRLTALAGAVWNYRRWSVAANLRYTGGYTYAAYADSILTCPTVQKQHGHCSTPGFVLLDLDLGYAANAHWSFGFNVHNALDHRPVYYANSTVPYSPAFDDIAGRYFLLSFRYRH